jgi:IS605 OrfB family transposase
MIKSGKKLDGVRLSNDSITFNFELPVVEKKEHGSILGIDIGKIDSITCSNGFASKTNSHGYNLGLIIDKLAKKKKGSKAYHRTQEHRTNFINWSINELNLEDFKQVNIEEIRHIRRGKRVNRKMQGWTYTTIFNKLKSKCYEQGVLVQELNPTYTSQRCSVCGRVRKANRKGKIFECDNCGHSQDADLNAARNISFSLPSISKKIRLMKLNLGKGFYWLESGFYFDSKGRQLIVAGTRKA